MKKALVILYAVIMVFGIGGVADAIPYTDTYNAGHYLMDPWGANRSVSWTFDITNDGFDPDTQDVTAASVIFNFEDNDIDSGWQFVEVAYLDVGANLFIWEIDTGDIGFTIESLVTLSNYGTVDATLFALYGDFYFNTATLSADGTAPLDDPTTVIPSPEPSTILLIGTGMLGLVVYGRKRFFLCCLGIEIIGNCQ